MRVLIIFFLSVLCLSASAQNIKIGFIDTEKIVFNLPQYKKSIESITREFEPKKQELLDLFKHIELFREKIELNKKTNSSNSNEIESFNSIGSELSKEIISLKCWG